MRESKASRTLLKSPPELWSEVSTATSLQRHMDQFGEIRITKLEPETAVAWEGEHARGTITLEVSGWGTKVSLTAEPTGNGATDATKPEAASQAEPQPADDRVKPADLGERAEPQRLDGRAEPRRLGTRVEPERPDIRVAPEGLGTRAAPESAGRPVEPEPTTSVKPPDDASTQRPRWGRRVAEAFRKWLSPPLEEDAVPSAPSPAQEPEHPAAEPGHPAARSTHIVPERDRPVASPKLPATSDPSPQQEPPPQIDEASTAALDATLDSLGQAHHRPFSRA